MKNPIFIMSIGIRGSGKSSTFNNALYSDYVKVSTDSIRIELTGDVSNQSRNADVFKIAHDRAISSLNAGNSTIYDATNVQYEGWKNLIKCIPSNCKKIAVVFHTDPDVTFKRISKDLTNGKNRSNVPLAVIHSQYALLEEMLESEVLNQHFDEIIDIK